MQSCGHTTTVFFRIPHPLAGVSHSLRQFIGTHHSGFMFMREARRTANMVMCGTCRDKRINLLKTVFGRIPVVTTWEPSRRRNGFFRAGKTAGPVWRGWFKKGQLAEAVAQAPSLWKMVAVFFRNLWAGLRNRLPRTA